MQHSALGVRQAAQARLQRSPHSTLRKIICEFNEGVLVLRGEVSSYYYKQLAQEAIADVDGIVRVVNEIQVVS